LITFVHRRGLVGDRHQRGPALIEFPKLPAASRTTLTLWPWAKLQVRSWITLWGASGAALRGNGRLINASCLGDNVLAAESVSPSRQEYPMTTVEIELPEATAQAAKAAGLLTPQAIDRLLSNALRKREATQYLQSVAAEVAAAGIAPISMEEIDAEVKIVRAERRARADRN